MEEYGEHYMYDRFFINKRERIIQHCFFLILFSAGGSLTCKIGIAESEID